MATGEAQELNTAPDRRIAIRALNHVDEFSQCVELQRQVWGFDDSDLVPARMFVVSRKIGGQVFGAWDGDRLVGYALAMPGDRNGHLYLHSHMLAVLADYRNAGVGRLLKLRQREDAIARGIDLMEWTFDPLEIKNAYFNIERLGAITRRYVPNQYGFTSSRLQAGLPSDRLVAEWWLRSKRAEQALRGERSGVTVQQRIEVPAEINDWKAAGDARAAAVQARNRETLLRAFTSGQVALGYERTAAGGAFLLGQWEEAWNYGEPHTEFSEAI
jgi:predicted GNAT superfamily acetyltransferase